MTLIKLDSSATNGTPQNFTTTFSNFVLEENVDFEIAMISLSMNYSYPNVSSSNGNNTVEYSPNGGTNFYTVTIPDGNWSVTSLNDYIQGQQKSNGHSSIVNGVDVFDITISFAFFLFRSLATPASIFNFFRVDSARLSKSLTSTSLLKKIFVFVLSNDSN